MSPSKGRGGHKPLGTSAIRYAMKNHVAVFENSLPTSLRSFLIPITAAY